MATASSQTETVRGFGGYPLNVRVWRASRSVGSVVLRVRLRAGWSDGGPDPRPGVFLRGRDG